MTLWVLLRAKALIWKNDLLRTAWRQRLGKLAFWALMLYLARALFFGVVKLFALVEAVFPGGSQALLVTTLSGLVAFALLWGVGSMLSQLYLTSDLELLLAAPIAPWVLYLLKLWEGLQTLVAPGLLSASCLLAYGVATDAAWPYFVLAALGFLCLLILLTAFSMAAIMVGVRLIPAQRAREAWIIGWTLIYVIVWAAWMVLSGRSRVDLTARIVEAQATVAQAGRYLTWSPAGWLARGVTAWRAGEWGVAGLNLGLLLLGTGLMAAIAYLAFRHAFYVGWARLQEERPRGRPASAAPARPTLRLLRPLPMQIRALAVREWTTLLRDMRQLSTLLFPIVAGVVYIYLSTSSEAIRQLPGAAIWIAMALLPIIPLFLALYHAVGTIGLEGATFALLRVAPLSAERLLWGKFLASLGPTLLISEAMTVIAALVLGASALQLLLFVLTTAWFTIGFVAIGIGAATIAPNFQAATTRRAAGPSAVYSVVLLGALFWLVSLAFAAYAVLKFGPPLYRGLLAQLVALALPQISPYLDSPYSIPVLIGAEIVLWGVIAALWKRGVAWIEAWEVSRLD